MSEKARVLVYILRRDLRLADNPIFHDIAKLHQQSHHPFTHLLPIYVFPADQVEVGGFIPGSANKRSPYPEARSAVAGFWRCGELRAKFLAESAWDLKEHLRKHDSDLVVRVGTIRDVVRSCLQGFAERKSEVDVHGVWMTSEEGVEEKREESHVRRLCDEFDTGFQLYKDEKYFVDE